MEALKSAIVATAAFLASCAPEPPAPRPLPPHSFAFAVFGDGPYDFRENGRFARVIDDVNRTDVAWFLHVGDIMWARCSDAALASRLEALKRIRPPVIYTPGDNEWADCHQRGGFPPLDRLQRIRRTYFANPTTSVAGAPMAVESQSANPAWKEFVENVRWRHGSFLFVTAHMIGSFNGTVRFRARTAADDSAVVRRTAAALAWLDTAFVIAKADSLRGVVIAIHGDPHFDRGREHGPYASFLAKLSELTSGYTGQVLLIHGDTHEYTLDHPLTRSSGQVLENFTRLETFGSPEIGWVRVVLDSVEGRVVEVEPRLMHRGLFW